MVKKLLGIVVLGLLLSGCTQKSNTSKTDLDNPYSAASKAKMKILNDAIAKKHKKIQQATTLMELKELLKNGTITQLEFKKAKKKLLN